MSIMAKMTALEREMFIVDEGNAEQPQQSLLEWSQVRDQTVAVPGDLDRRERDLAQRLEEIVAGRTGRDMAGQQIRDLGLGAQSPARFALDQVEDQHGQAQDRDQPDDAPITGHKQGPDPKRCRGGKFGRVQPARW